MMISPTSVAAKQNQSVMEQQISFMAKQDIFTGRPSQLLPDYRLLEKVK